MKPIQVGDRAPNFTAPTQSGATVTLADYLGKQAVVLYFYPRDNTSVCTQQACAFRDAYEQFTTAGAVVIGVSSDSSERHEAFSSSKRLPFLLISDADGKLRTLFGVPKYLVLLPGRVTYVIDKQGIVRHIFNSMFDADAHVREALGVVQQLAKE